MNIVIGGLSGGNLAIGGLDPGSVVPIVFYVDPDAGTSVFGGGSPDPDAGTVILTTDTGAIEVDPDAGTIVVA